VRSKIKKEERTIHNVFTSIIKFKRIWELDLRRLEEEEEKA
jgi:hypothetical protein